LWSQALENCRQRAAAGDTQAMLELARAYGSGIYPFSKDLHESNRYYTLAADLGDKEAVRHLYDVYRWGFDVPKNQARADQYLNKAAQFGHEWAILLLAQAEEKSAPKKALEAYLKLGRNDNCIAQARLAQAYESGDLVKQNLTQSFFWLLLAGVDGFNRTADVKYDITSGISYESYIPPGQCSHAVYSLREKIKAEETLPKKLVQAAQDAATNWTKGTTEKLLPSPPPPQITADEAGPPDTKTKMPPKVATASPVEESCPKLATPAIAPVSATVPNSSAQSPNPSSRPLKQDGGKAAGGSDVRAGPYEAASAAYERGDYATALSLFRQLADQGNAKAQYKLGLIYYSGEGVPTNVAEAAKWFRKAADQGEGGAQHYLGMMYEEGEGGVPKDLAEAAKWTSKAAEQGSMYAQRDLASKYYNGEGVPKNFAEAAKWYRKAADQGERVSQSLLGQMYSKGEGVPQNYVFAYMWLSLSNFLEKHGDIVAAMTPEQIAEGKKLAREWNDADTVRLVLPLAEGGSEGAQIEMGVMYAQGQGVTKDFKEAMKWFRLAADKGNTEAMNFLGALFHDGGNGVAQDYREAVKWYKLAAQKGDANAQETLGAIFYDGDAGVAQDYKEAAKCYRLAADKGSREAELRLGYMNYNGQGVTQDYKEALKWYRLAADQGDAQAQYFLGNMYNEGKGVVQDYREAVKWHRLAAQQGEPRSQLVLGINYYGGKEGVAQDYQYSYMWLSLAASKLDGKLADVAVRQRNGVAKEMTDADVLAAQEMAKRCEGSNYKQCDRQETNQSGSSVTSFPMKAEGGTYVIPVLINDAITLDFIVDSGASDVSIPSDVVTTLMRTGTLKQSDFLGQKTYQLADGSAIPSQTFRIRSLKVGGKVIENVNGSVASVRGPLLLGQSFLTRFKSWSIDNNKHALVLE
jgi:TPR repeat protein